MREQMIAAGLWNPNDPRDPSESIEAAWSVVEKLRPDWLFIIETSGSNYVADFCRSGNPFKRGIAPTAPEAICRAALLAVATEEG